MSKSLLLGVFLGRCFAADVLPPAIDRALAHDIFKQIVEIKSGYTTGSRRRADVRQYFYEGQTFLYQLVKLLSSAQ